VKKLNLKNMFRKMRFTMSDPILHEEEWSVHIKPISLIGSVAAFCLFLFLLVLILVAYTPILDIFPGYRTAAERTHDDLVQNIMRIDSLERRMNDMLTYNENISMIMEGRTPALRTPLSDGDTTVLDKTLVPPSQFDSLLRAQMEGDGDYSLARTLQRRTQGDNTLIFVAPADGIITRHFSREDNYLGVGIQSSPNAPVTAIDDGSVVAVAEGERGSVVTVQHYNGFVSVYRNLAQVLVVKGQSIKSRQVVGYNAMPSVGDKSNPLVEVELWNEGRAVDPEVYIVF
jgi:murein DD-endopeptidase MepM/ murein hydrolase activator NlpD